MSRGFGRPCPDCGRSQYAHPNGRASVKPTFNDQGEFTGFSRGCDLRLVSFETMTDSRTGEIIKLKGYAPESPFPRTAHDPRSWKHVSNLMTER